MCSPRAVRWLLLGPPAALCLFDLMLLMPARSRATPVLVPITGGAVAEMQRLQPGIIQGARVGEKDTGHMDRSHGRAEGHVTQSGESVDRLRRI
ncbi:hypothetical protein SU48_12980 [Deinococcus puniceus]|uniref:Uncharacterized protein n=1 Tax=Deinococcus puniceus TaxID=1182568 RepID=A0A172TC64_9DEIO|nr:hypothetical protein SU48_12980 [Deinococcus puniceus]